MERGLEPDLEKGGELTGSRRGEEPYFLETTRNQSLTIYEILIERDLGESGLWLV